MDLSELGRAKRGVVSTSAASRVLLPPLPGPDLVPNTAGRIYGWADPVHGTGLFPGNAEEEALRRVGNSGILWRPLFGTVTSAQFSALTNQRCSLRESDAPAWVFFIDDDPLAAWPHLARFVCVHTDGVVEIVAADVPPSASGDHRFAVPR